jgi:hypothetical protein
MALLKDQFSLLIKDGFSYNSIITAEVLNYQYGTRQENEDQQLTEEQQKVIDEARERAQQNNDRAEQGRRR